MNEPSMICINVRPRAGWVFIALLLGAAAFAGCGDDVADAPGDDAGSSDAAPERATSGAGGAGTSGAGGRGAAASGAGGRAGAAGRPAPAIPCGATMCQSPATGFPRACCADEASGTCGTSLMPGQCTAPVAGEHGCPPLDFAGILVLPSCCTSHGMCGVDSSGVGGTGCVDLATAAERARMFGASAAFPAPRACDEADAGVQDDAGAS